jgi:2-oxoisovalerate dehydrogenase E2 component (dihydrolipoyl transacylase)
MSKDFILPDIGEGIVECEVVEWLVAEGDTIVEDQPVCDVMTDKALVQIPAISDGVVTKLFYAKGEIAKVHEPLFSYSSVGEGAAEATPAQGVVEQVMDHTPVAAVEPKTKVLSDAGVEDFLLPDIGEGIVECELVDWLVAEGDEVKEDQPICDVMTDKALVQIPAKSDGVIDKLYYAKGEIAKVHEPLFAIRVAGSAATQQTVSAPKVASTPVSAQAATTETVAKSANVNVASEKVVPNGKKAVASPAVRRLAREMNLDITMVQGSGAKGRVYKEDLVAHNQAPVAQALAPIESAVEITTRVEPIRGVKAAMAKAMQESVSTIPHFTYSDEVDLTQLVALRKKLKPEYEKQGIKLTMMPFFMKAMSMAMKEFPIMNSQPNAECTELTYFDDHNIGMAVDSKVGLLVPNIKSCNHKSIKQIAIDVMEMTGQAREGRLSPEQLKGGTISISNIGALGGTTATPIINKPEVAIVALGKMQTLPRFDAQGNVEARQIMNVSWSGDHRIIDGGTIARFNNLWTKYLEDPTSMLMDMI